MVDAAPHVLPSFSGDTVLPSLLRPRCFPHRDHYSHGLHWQQCWGEDPCLIDLNADRGYIAQLWQSRASIAKGLANM